MSYKGIGKIDPEIQEAVETKKIETEGIKQYVETCVDYGVCPRCGGDLNQIYMVDGLEHPKDIRIIGANSIMTQSGDLQVRFGVKCAECGWINLS